jgi:hypothetical protein
MIHEEPSPLAGQTVALKEGGHEYRVEDWWDRVGGQSWMDMAGNPACLNYAVRSAKEGLPIDDQVLYGKIGAFGHLIHVSEIENEDA